MKTAVMFRWSLVLVGLLLLPLPTRAEEDAQVILKKAFERVQRAKTYQCRLQLDMSIEGASTFSMSANVDSKLAGKKYRMESFISELISEGKDEPKTYLSVSDGHTAYDASFTKSGGSYEKTKVEPSNLVIRLLTLIKEEPSRYELLPDALLDDKPAYAIEYSRKVETSILTTTIYIDKKTYGIKRFRMMATAPKGTLRFGCVMKSEKLDEPIPDALFKFTPPGNVKEARGETQIASNPLAMMAMLFAGGGVAK